MNPLPTIYESFALLGGLPDEVPTRAIHLLGWLRIYTEPDGKIRVTNDDLVLATHLEISSVKRAFQDVQKTWALVQCEYLFQDGRRTIRSKIPPGRPGAPRGKYLGRVCEINWDGIARISNRHRLKMSPQNMETGSLTEAPFRDTASDSDSGQGVDHMTRTMVCADQKSEADCTLVLNPQKCTPNEVLGGSLRATGEERKEKELQNSFSLTPTPADMEAGLGSVKPPILSADWSRLLDRMNGTYREVQARAGVKSPKDMCLGDRAERMLKSFLAVQEAKGIWLAWERVANWFTIWVENHPLKKLKFASSVFVQESEGYRQRLDDWEAANPTIRWRELPSVSLPDLEDPEVEEVCTFVFNIAKVLPPKKEVWILLQKYDVETVTTAFDHYINPAHEDIVLNGSRDVKTHVRAFFASDAVPAALAALKAWEEWREQEKEQKRQYRLYIVGEIHADRVVFESWFYGDRFRVTHTPKPGQKLPDWMVVGFQMDYDSDTKKFGKPHIQLPQRPRDLELIAAQAKREKDAEAAKLKAAIECTEAEERTKVEAAKAETHAREAAEQAEREKQAEAIDDIEMECQCNYRGASPKESIIREALVAGYSADDIAKAFGQYYEDGKDTSLFRVADIANFLAAKTQAIVSDSSGIAAA